jgi:hypothetical protein
MDVPEQIGEPVPGRLVGLGFYISLESNIRDDWLKQNIAEPLHDLLAEYCRGFTEAHTPDDPPRFMRLASMVGPFLSQRESWRDFRDRAEGDYERILDPQDMESAAQYERDHEPRDTSTREPGW